MTNNYLFYKTQNVNKNKSYKYKLYNKIENKNTICRVGVVAIHKGLLDRHPHTIIRDNSAQSELSKNETWLERHGQINPPLLTLILTLESL